MTLLVENLPAFMSAPLSLLLAEDAPALPAPIPQWRVAARDGHWLMMAQGSASPGPALPLPAAPGGLLGVIAATTPAWLTEWPGEAPALLADGTALAGLLAARLLAAEARVGDMSASLVALRAEQEEARVAMASWLRSAGQAPPQAPTLIHADTPDASPVLWSGVSTWRRSLPSEIAGVTALAVHLKAVAAGPGSVLGLRLIAEESGRLAGAWRVPGEALHEGWMTLDLPMPAPPWRETAAVEVSIALAPRDTLALSVTEGLPALQVLRARGGARFQHSPWWLEQEAGRPMPPSGVWCSFPDDIWQGATRTALLHGHGETSLGIPSLPLAGYDLMRAVLRVSGGSDVQAALSCGGRGTGWVDAQLDGDIALSLAISPEAWPAAPVRVALRALGSGGAVVEWREIRAARSSSGANAA
ncbi:hypothetical protein EOD42_23585 [Rhodovarius crocodyli]|uniref:Uncharacterized protein n=1 Tax=Rhodovarius crocodyli TaxID=1979269 RepID=A0A437LZ51_9PROT|nr:DUF6212 domain-containing protein [Rhodovarius crocodyli]RVT90616.1 hypothetical protein EOD42_23585 [Rhodovarius crocodyli]